MAPCLPSTITSSTAWCVAFGRRSRPSAQADVHQIHEGGAARRDRGHANEEQSAEVLACLPKATRQQGKKLELDDLAKRYPDDDAKKR
jgi:hypothetical protein